MYGENDELPEGKSFATYYEEGDEETKTFYMKMVMICQKAKKLVMLKKMVLKLE